MYFASVEHKNNFELLMEKYRPRIGEDVQYKASIYVCAYPQIFKCIDNVENIDLSRSPLFHLAEWDDEVEEFIVSAAGLTGSTRRLVEVGLSCYNGFPIQLDVVLSVINTEELLEILFTTIKIRTRTVSI